MYEHGDISLAYPIARGSGVAGTALGSIFLLREPLSAVGATGIASVCAGVFALGFQRRVEPVRARAVALAVTVMPPEADVTVPTISVTSPADGAAVSSTVSVLVSAADNIGVVKVELYADGALKATSTKSPFTTSWNARKASKGRHTLQCRAYDAAGNAAGSALVTVYK